MTALQLLAYISAALLLQLAVGIGAGFWRLRSVVKPPSAHDESQPQSVSAAAWSGWREFRVMRREYEDALHSQCSFYLAPLDGAPLPPFKPGQFLTFSLEVADSSSPGGRRAITRCYSLSERPDPTGYRITVKRVNAPPDRPELPAGLSSNHLHDQVQPGQVLKVKAPSGHFHIDAAPDVPVVLIGGGIGITPMASMLRWCLAEQPSRTVHLYYGVRHSGEQAFKLQLEELARVHPNFHLNVVYSRPGSSDVVGRDYQHQGHVDVELLRRTLPHGRHHFYVCGPAPMMESIVAGLAQWDVPRQDIHFEAFGPATVRSDAALPAEPGSRATVAFEVRFQRAGRTLVWDGQDANLLELAERHAVEVESGCRSGSCGSCEVKLLSGSVHYAQDPDHDVAPGCCLLCVGKPGSALVLEA
ncbi:MAG: 2Fe-2S iron-sulfur cluster binding domain-containing protein [Rhodoferax sp.]|nr:2Fe-2S iron-sulfur cluster binding domain-containing protein [Rhodoferax sp.]